MKNLCIFALAFTISSVSCLPRQRRQFDWAAWENNGNVDWSTMSRTTRQINENWGQQGNGNDWDQGFNQGQNGNQGLPNEIDNAFSLGQNQGVSTTTQGTTTTKIPESFRRCNAACTSTQEYNPVCGTDGNTYHNIHRLRCASRCGANVSFLRGSTCQPL